MLVTKGPTSQNWWEYHEPGVLPRSGHKRRRRVPGKNWEIYDTWPSILEFCTAKSFPIGMAPAHYWVGLRYLKTVFSLAAIGAIDE
jgi:hypothetical protein